jgi:DNA-binding HxlR family transcriptional regulator
MSTDRHLPETMEKPVASDSQSVEVRTEVCADGTCVFTKETEDLVRDLMVRFGDKWSLRVMDELYERGAMRFSRLRERLDGVSQKMLTQTLRQLERDGVVIRRVYAEVPPRVDYELTSIGIKLSEALCGVWEWAIQNEQLVHAARRAFDAQTTAGTKSSPRDD